MWVVTDEYAPSADLQAAIDAYDKARADAETARKQLRTAVAAELKTYDVTNEDLADFLPWSGETVRGIAREFKIPPKRKPTVQSINAKRRRKDT